MTQQVKTRKPGTKLLGVGAGALVLGIILLIANLTSTKSEYIAGRGMVDTSGQVGPGVWILLVIGLALVVWGFCKRLLGAVER